MPARNLNYSVGGKRILGTPKTGVLGSLIPSSGDNGAGYAYNDLSLPADAGKEIRGRITTWPASGTLYAYEDTSFTFTAPDGTYSFQYQLYVDGVATGSPVTVTLQVGPVTHAATGSLSASSASLSASAARTGVVIHVASGSLVSQPALLSAVAEQSLNLTLTTDDINAIAQAVLALLQANTIPVNVMQMNSAPVIGTGQIGDDWRGQGVQPQ